MDTENHSIRRIDANTDVVIIIAGGELGGHGDGGGHGPPPRLWNRR